MPSRRHRSVSRAGLAIAALVVGVLCGCASHRPAASGPALAPAEVYRALLGRNPGLASVRAVAEARLSFAGRQVSLPGVLLLDTIGGFRLELLDPLDRPLAVLFADDGRIVNFRPGPALAASLGVFPQGCSGVDPADWVAAVLSASVAPVAGETIADRPVWGGGRVLERRRGEEVRASVRYENEAGRLLPRQIAWYCGEEAVLQMRVLEWVTFPDWTLPALFEVRFPKAGLDVRLQLSEIEANPPASGKPLRPRLGTEVRWTAWNLPQ